VEIVLLLATVVIFIAW